MRKGAKVLAKALIVLFSLPLLIVMLLQVLGYALDLMLPCSDSILHESTSPGGSYTAVISEGDCGATTPVSTHLVIRSARGEELVLIYEGHLDLTLRWLSPTELWIVNQTREPQRPIKIYRKEDRHDGLSITYDGFSDSW